MLVMFLCVHCPYVKHVEEELARIGRDYRGKIGMVGISSNDVAAYPQDSPEEMKKQAERLGFCFPYLYDETQEVARAYEAACTPDLFLFDSEMKLVYRGQLDDSRPRRGDSAQATVDRPGKLTLVLERGTRATITHSQGALVLALDEGAVEAQVVPVPSGEAFAVDVGSSRVAVHGTHLRVARAGGHPPTCKHR